LSPTGFKFTLTRAPKVSYFCNEANIPDLSLGVTFQPTILEIFLLQETKLNLVIFHLRFLVDENLENYMEIQNWIRGLGYPESVGQL
jgi:hypothetical protein